MKKVFIFLFVFFLLIPIVLAQCPPDCEYENLDWSTIEPEDIPEVPPEKLDYSQLSFKQRRAMTPEQIALNFDNIRDLTVDVSSQNAIKAIKLKYDVDVISLHTGAKISDDKLYATSKEASEEFKEAQIFVKDLIKDQLEKADIKEEDFDAVLNKLLNEISEDYFITLTEPIYQDGEIELQNFGILAFIPNPGNALDIPKQDFLVIDTKENTFSYTKDNTLFSFKGKMEFFEDTIKSVPYQKLYINNHYLLDDSTGLDLYFDGQTHEPSDKAFISFSKDQKSITMGNNDDFYSADIDFLPGNPIFNVEETDDFYLTFSNANIKITNRDEEELIPKIEFIDQGDGFLAIRDGKIYLNHYMFKHKRKEVSLEIEKEGNRYSSTPLTLEMYGPDGNTILGTQEEPYKLIITNHNEYGIIPQTAQKGLETTDTLFDLDPGEIGETLEFNYVLFSEDLFLSEYPNILLNEPQDPLDGMPIFAPITPEIIKKLTDSLKQMTPEMVESIRGFYIWDEQDLVKKMDGIGITGGIAATGPYNTIAFGPSGVFESAIFHEAAHALNNKITEKDHAENGRTQYLKYTTSPPDFEDLWYAIAKEGYTTEDIGEEFGKGIFGESLIATWKDGTRGPRYGCVRPYGCSNIHEDVATFFEETRNPEFFAPLLNPKSPQYDRIYVRKLTMLKSYDFISEETYQEIFSIADAWKPKE